MKKFGFSLLEIIIGLALSAMLGTVLFNTFFQSTRTLRLVDEYSELDTGISIVLTQLERDLAGTFVPEYEPEQKKDLEQKEEAPDKKQQQEKKKKKEPSFVAKTKNKHLDFISFVTSNPLSRFGAPLPTIAPKPSLVRVLYKLRENKEKKGAFVLTRQESTNLDLASFEKKSEKRPRELVVADAVKECSMEFVYKIEKKETDEKEGKQEFKTVTEWGSAKEQSEEIPPLPTMIKLALTVWDAQLQVTRSIEYLLPIYCVYVESAQSEKKEKAEESDAENKAQNPEAPQTPKALQQTDPRLNMQTRPPFPPRQKLSMNRRRPSFTQQFMGGFR